MKKSDNFKRIGTSHNQTLLAVFLFFFLNASGSVLAIRASRPLTSVRIKLLSYVSPRKGGVFHVVKWSGGGWV